APHQVAAAFGDDFEIVLVQGVSVLTPPADHKTFSTRFPRLYRLLVWLDDKVSNARPFRGWGDFFILTMRYAPRESR
ncbi:MAG: hypothetical protein KGJ80_09750, partial [Chloroflexota bacterium]|nr:hypothetical protein [Chloroflexota bacterium]